MVNLPFSLNEVNVTTQLAVMVHRPMLEMIRVIVSKYNDFSGLYLAVDFGKTINVWRLEWKPVELLNLNEKQGWIILAQVNFQCKTQSI